MSLQLLEAFLIGPDNAASQQQLVGLINAGQFAGSGLPQVAHGYLDAFCNVSNSNGRRRWAGIALAAMMRASTGVVQRLKKLTHGLSRVGAIILDLRESEERRIVAGLIIRQGLEVGIDFADFWMSDKVLHSAPNFPRDSSDLWMSNFQTYLDTLSSLALANWDNEPVVLFPIAVSAKDGILWTGKSAVALLEKDVLTIVVSDDSLSTFSFIDLPVHQIKETSLQSDCPHESQEGRSGDTMHKIVITLRPETRHYYLNSLHHTADEFKVSFLRHEDAHELDLGLQDARKNSARSATSTAEVATVMKSSSPMRAHRASVQQVETSLSLSHEGAASNESNTESGAALDRPVSSEQVAEDRTLVLPTKQKRSNGRLPRVSLSTKQKVARCGKLPSASAKATKPRASKQVAPIIEESGDEHDEMSSQDEYALQSTAATSKPAATATAKKAQGRRKGYANDDDFDPKTTKAKSSTKRKRGFSEADEDSQPTKKTTQATPGNSWRSGAVNTTTKKPRAHLVVHTASASDRVSMKQPSALKHLQHGQRAQSSLIGALRKSNSPAKADTLAFKRPGQPASTPGRPRAQPVRTTPRPQTPADNLPAYGPSSTPRSKSIHDEDFGHGDTPANSEILSSNTKRVPDSPHAESTAISGHADRDDVQREKCIGDLELAKSDPFKQRRQGVQKMNSFTRKLTGESIADDQGRRIQGEPLSMPAEIANDDLGTDNFSITFASQPLPKRSPSLFKRRTNANRQNVVDPVAHVRTVDRLSTKGSCRVSTSKIDKVDQHGVPTTERTLQEGQRAQANDSVASAQQEAVEDTLPLMDTLLEAPTQLADNTDYDEEAALVNEMIDLPQQHGTRASDLQFRSSPPIADSSSVRGEASDESEQDPDLSPATSRADELEWETALQPHQRALHEQLLRTSKRVVRHIVDNETAVTNITDVFATDGERILDLLIEKQGKQSAEAFEALKSKRKDLLKELSHASKNLKAQRKQIRGIE